MRCSSTRPWDFARRALLASWQTRVSEWLAAKLWSTLSEAASLEATSRGSTCLPSGTTWSLSCAGRGVWPWQWTSTPSRPRPRCLPHPRHRPSCDNINDYPSNIQGPERGHDIGDHLAAAGGAGSKPDCAEDDRALRLQARLLTPESRAARVVPAPGRAVRGECPAHARAVRCSEDHLQNGGPPG
jgi:hypothetical protein